MQIRGDQALEGIAGGSDPRVQRDPDSLPCLLSELSVFHINRLDAKVLGHEVTELGLWQPLRGGCLSIEADKSVVKQ